MSPDQHDHGWWDQPQQWKPGVPIYRQPRMLTGRGGWDTQIPRFLFDVYPDHDGCTCDRPHGQEPWPTGTGARWTADIMRPEPAKAQVA